MLKIVRAKIIIHNPHRVNPQPCGKYVILCSHSSHYDIPISIMALKDFPIRMMAKKELTKIPLFGQAIRHSDSPIVDRSNRKKAFASIQHAKKILEKGIAIWIAPEGTRSIDGKIMPLKNGGFKLAMKAEATIIPVFIKGANKILAAKNFDFYINQTVDVYIGEPIPIKEQQAKNLDILKEAVLNEWQKHV